MDIIIQPRFIINKCLVVEKKIERKLKIKNNSTPDFYDFYIDYMTSHTTRIIAKENL